MMRAARPAAAAIPANAVWRAPPAEEEEEDPVAAWDAWWWLGYGEGKEGTALTAEPALEALEARLDASEPALEASLESCSLLVKFPVHYIPKMEENLRKKQCYWQLQHRC